MPNFSFGGGPRDCIGNHFAWMEVCLCLRLLQSGTG
ncbi:cytochrome P450 [Peribacillus butanolivorans]|uniref:Cytochrome P450 n=1 Tax=Peribacillus butanolivorans TaxID=421767 RepID=A0ABN5N879_9BACI|nr:cytochrome P450 [Peribacillus butanolivorans]